MESQNMIRTVSLMPGSRRHHPLALGGDLLTLRCFFNHSHATDLDHVRSIQVTPVQQQQAKQDALERASLASHGSSSSEEASRTRPSFDSVGFHSMASASSSRSQPANQPSLRPTPAVSSPQGRPLSPPPPRLLQQNGHHQQQHHHHQPKVGSPGQRSFASSNMNQSYKPQIAESTRSKRSRQRPTKPGGVAPSIASSSLLSPASILSQATSTSSYSAASTDYNPLTYRPSDAVRTYRTSETLRPIRDSSESQLALAPALFPAPLAPSYHPTLPVTTHFPRSYADDYSSSAVGGTMPSSSVTSFTPTNSEAFRASVPRGNSMSTIRGGRAPPPATGTNTPTNSVAWSDTDYHLENGRIVDQHDPSTYLPTLVGAHSCSLAELSLVSSCGGGPLNHAHTIVVTE